MAQFPITGSLTLDFYNRNDKVYKQKTTGYVLDID